MMNKKICILICSHSRANTLEKTINKFRLCKNKFKFYIQTHNKDSYDYIKFREDDDIELKFVPNEVQNHMGKIREASRKWVCENFRKDDIIISADDNVKFKPEELDLAIDKFCEKDLLFLAAHNKIFEFYQKDNPKYHAGDLIDLTVIYAVFWMTRKSVFEEVKYDENLAIQEDVDWQFNFIRKYGNEKRLMYKKWNYAKARHESGGIKNEVKTREYYEKACRHFNDKWGGKYAIVSKKPNVRTSFKKFIVNELKSAITMDFESIKE